MVEHWINIVIATAFPAAFLVHLLWSKVVLARRRIGLTGRPPIDGRLFFACKGLAIGAWFAVSLQSIGIGWRPFAGFRVPVYLSGTLWVLGFTLLFLGRIDLGTHFRLGLPNETTPFRRGGVYRLTRNPMYAGIDVTMIAAVLCTGNPAVVAAGAYVLVVQHRIILVEERWMLATFGEDYARYRERVGRYVTLPCVVRSPVQALLTLLGMGHCAPTIMSSILHVSGRKADWLVRLVSAMPGGIGNTGGECGGITSPLMLLGLIHGLGGIRDGLPIVFDRSHNHLEGFRLRRGTVLCREIRTSPKQVVPCIRTIVHSGALCADTLCGTGGHAIPGPAREARGRVYAAFDGCGFHCAQSVLRQLDGLRRVKPLLDAASAFLGGTSFTGMTCSALTAGAMALGLRIGEIETNPWRVFRMVFLLLTGGPAFHDRVNRFNRAMNRGGELAAWFTARFGSSQCREITGADFSSMTDVEAYLRDDGITRCRRIADEVAGRVRFMLAEAATRDGARG